MDDDRFNCPSTSAVTFEVLGHQLQISQDPNSKHLGTTVWDASMVFVKFLVSLLKWADRHSLETLFTLNAMQLGGRLTVSVERNSRKGRFCPSKLKGKRAVELGAGCGLAGFGMALLGCDVVSTDQVEVLPLLMRNVERNTSWIMQANPDSASFGSITVEELDWGNKDHIKALEPPFDYIIGTDVVYAEHLLEPLLQTILALSGPRTTIMLGYEIRSTTVHERMIQMWKDNFEVKTVPRSKMDYKYRHPSIQLFIMEQKAQSKCEGSVCNELKLPESNRGESEDSESNAIEGNDDIHDEKPLDKEIVGTERGEVDDWETRRHGAMAARLLKDVKIM